MKAAGFGIACTKEGKKKEVNVNEWGKNNICLCRFFTL